MIKIERNLGSPKITKAIEILKEERIKTSGIYNKQEVLDALEIVFNTGQSSKNRKEYRA